MKKFTIHQANMNEAMSRCVKASAQFLATPLPFGFYVVEVKADHTALCDALYNLRPNEMLMPLIELESMVHDEMAVSIAGANRSSLAACSEGQLRSALKVALEGIMDLKVKAGAMRP